ncbi:hypothetical protein PCH70_02780 [Pseudomonas cichorii JBC1]|nr:hypothetical protein PCH70_02780 [Pseudomonas cichorii JBC1]
MLFRLSVQRNDLRRTCPSRCPYPLFSPLQTADSFWPCNLPRNALFTG